MREYLPYSGFRWSKQKEIDGLDVNSVSENSFDGYILDFIFLSCHVRVSE